MAHLKFGAATRIKHKEVIKLYVLGVEEWHLFGVVDAREEERISQRSSEVGKQKQYTRPKELATYPFDRAGIVKNHYSTINYEKFCKMQRRGLFFSIEIKHICH